MTLFVMGTILGPGDAATNKKIKALLSLSLCFSEVYILAVPRDYY